jgi:hypothetical protein
MSYRRLTGLEQFCKRLCSRYSTQISYSKLSGIFRKYASGLANRNKVKHVKKAQEIGQSALVQLHIYVFPIGLGLSHMLMATSPRSGPSINNYCSHSQFPLAEFLARLNGVTVPTVGPSVVVLGSIAWRWLGATSLPVRPDPVSHPAVIL